MTSEREGVASHAAVYRFLGMAGSSESLSVVLPSLLSRV